MSDEPDDEDPTRPSWGLLCPFLDPSETYALGVEFGMLWEQMRRKQRIKGYFLRGNQEQILLAASRMGWHVKQIETHDKSWFWLTMSRTGVE